MREMKKLLMSAFREHVMVSALVKVLKVKTVLKYKYLKGTLYSTVNMDWREPCSINNAYYCYDKFIEVLTIIIINENKKQIPLNIRIG